MLWKFTLSFLFLLLFQFNLACAEGPDPSVSGAQSAEDGLRVGTFNLLRLGHGDSKNYRRLANLIEQADYDLFAATEVMTSEGADELLTHLRDSGRDWQMTLSPFATGESSYKEYFAFYYDAKALTPKSDDEQLCLHELTVSKSGNGCYLKDEAEGTDAPFYERDPFLAEFTFNSKHYAFFAVHVIYGKQTSAGFIRRQGEVAKLLEAMDELKASFPQTELVALGDFNLELSKSLHEPEGKYLPKYVGRNADWIVGVDKPTTVGKSNYDHVITATTGSVMEESVLVDFSFSDSAEKGLYKSEVSDHLPVIVELAH